MEKIWYGIIPAIMFFALIVRVLWVKHPFKKRYTTIKGLVFGPVISLAYVGIVSYPLAIQIIQNYPIK